MITQQQGRVQHEGVRAGEARAREEYVVPRDRGQRGGRSASEWNKPNEERLARGLAWFGIGLGLVEVAAPRAIGGLVGIGGRHRSFIRALGLREIASGIAILMQRRPVEGTWARVGGDAIDLACLAAAFTLPHAKPGRVAAATAAVAGVTVLDVVSARQLTGNGKSGTATGGVQVKKRITVGCSPEELYRFWHDFENLPRFMSYLKSVQVTGDKRSHWVAKAPVGTTVEWDAEITDDRPNELIAWRAVPGGSLDHEGSVRFDHAPGGRGTEVHVELAYRPPGGLMGVAVAKLFGQAPDQQIQEDLRRVKQVMEAGEISTTTGQARGA